MLIATRSQGRGLALLLAEPAAAARQGLSRIADLCRHFRVPAMVLLNTCDLNPDPAASIHSPALAQGLAMAGELPYHLAFAEAQCAGRTVAGHDPDGPGRTLARTAAKILEALHRLRPMDGELQLAFHYPTEDRL